MSDESTVITTPLSNSVFKASVVVKYVFWTIVVLSVVWLLDRCVESDATDVALEIIKTIGLVGGGGAAGFVVGTRKTSASSSLTDEV